MDLGRTRAVARKELRQFRRDPRSLALAFLLPVLLLALFGYAITFDVEDVETAVHDRDRSAASRSLVDAFETSGKFTVVRRLDRYDRAEPLLDAGRVRMVLVIPDDYSERLGGGETARVQALVDGADANTATLALGYARGVVRSRAGEVRLAGPSPAVEADTRVWYNRELESVNMIVPGLVAVVMMIIAAMLTSLTVAREWERGTMEQLISTPVRRSEVILGKLAPYVGIGMLDVGLVSAVGVGVFGVPFRGSAALLALLSLAFIVGACGLGIFISAVARTQVLATQMSMIGTFLPAFLLSGFMFEIGVLPTALEAVTYLVPARYFLVVTRGIFLKSTGLDVLYLQAFLMLAFAALGATAAVAAFRKRLPT